MKQKKNIFLFLLVVIFLISTTGVTVYKHYCSYSGMFYGVFVDVSHDCESEVDKDIEETHVCCTSSSTSDIQIKEECCTSDVHLYQIDTDLATNNFKVDFINNFTLSFSISVAFIIPDYRKIPTSNKAPPVLLTLERLSLFQLYLI